MATVKAAQRLPLSADKLPEAAPGSHAGGRWAALLGCAFVTATLVTAWLSRDDNLIHAGHGAGYWLGVCGASLMGLLLLYPVRKRSRWMRRLGPVSAWFRVHMLFGVLGPLLIILHSNFKLGSVNGRLAMFATLIVAGSGIIGRYIYAKLHHGLYGQRASVAELRAQVLAQHRADNGPLTPLAEPLAWLTDYETQLLDEKRGLAGAFLRALSVVPETVLLRRRILREVKRRLGAQAVRSRVIAREQLRLQQATRRHVTRRIRALRKYAQFRAFEALFSLWHLVHYPLFVVMVCAVIVHILAVHMY